MGQTVNCSRIPTHQSFCCYAWKEEAASQEHLDLKIVAWSSNDVVRFQRVPPQNVWLDHEVSARKKRERQLMVIAVLPLGKKIILLERD